MMQSVSLKADWKKNAINNGGCVWAWTKSSDGVALETPIIALGFLKHLPEGTLPFTSFLIFFFDPERYLHHAPRDVPVAPQRLNSFIVITWARGLVEQWSPCILVFANKFNLFQGIFRFPFLHLLPNFTNGCFSCDWNSKHAKSSQNFHFRYMVLIALGNLCSPLFDQATFLVPDFTVWCCVFRKNDFLPFFFSHRSTAQKWAIRMEMENMNA